MSLILWCCFDLSCVVWSCLPASVRFVLCFAVLIVLCCIAVLSSCLDSLCLVLCNAVLKELSDCRNSKQSTPTEERQKSIICVKNQTHKIQINARWELCVISFDNLLTVPLLVSADSDALQFHWRYQILNHLFVCSLGYACGLTTIFFYKNMDRFFSFTYVNGWTVNLLFGY